MHVTGTRLFASRLFSPSIAVPNSASFLTTRYTDAEAVSKVRTQTEWEPWLKLQQRKATWRKKTGHKEPATGTRIKVQWSERWECDHAGNRRDRRKAGWQHTGHIADSLDDMRASRNPDDVRAWLDDKVKQGFDQKAIKSFLRMTSDELAEITPDSDAVPYSIKISAMDIHNAIRRKADIDTWLAPDLDESVELWLEKLRETIMIDCSDPEALGICSAFPELVIHILYCYWHLWKAWDANIKDKLVFKYMRCKEDRAELIKEHAHYGIDTNNFIESWHSNLKNYIGHNRRQRLDYIIRILSQDVEPDYMRAHVRSGLGFRARNLCKAETEAKKFADQLSFDDAEASVQELNDNQILCFSSLRRVDDIYYVIAINNEKITTCSCPVHVQSRLTCKHMFLVLRVTNYAIDLPHTIIPSRRSRDIEEEETLEAHHTYKRRMISKLREEITKLGLESYWIIFSF
ncbi:hypothetical protein M422DRAFT_275152 [Sphaerobolus stellatus SS14]|uniref:SWIM-type domain-containing protein n=1 Tax=Sphaerobolus stellatus (strain SS14) TaxID=990650 RepID=A0A0C9T5G9_SPHS4|nr:hypothetical protein M422DRAFT_275152 [Sphaerobolus stellatus SS14]